MDALSLPREREMQMKRVARFGWLLVAALTVATALSLTGCQAGSAWRADGTRADTAWGGTAVDAGRERPCRFG
jgi:hypothetical protein